MAKPLSPAFLRFGGNDADRMKFGWTFRNRERYYKEVKYRDCHAHDFPRTDNFTMTGTVLDGVPLENLVSISSANKICNLL